MSLLIRSTLAEHAHPPTTPHVVVVAPPSPEAIAEAIAVIAHEMRNSLAVLRNAARLLRTPTTPGGPEFARVLIERHVAQLSCQVLELLETSRTRLPRAGLALLHIDLRVIVGFAIDDIATDLTRRGLKLSVSLPAEAIYVHADSARLEQAFSNLLVNAAKYTPMHGEVSVAMDLDEGHARVRIGDSGIGIAPGLLSRIFDLFMQVDAAAPRAEGGFGIGLAVVREAVRLHGGSVSAASAGLGLGSEFMVRLPAVWTRPVAAV
jgi:signal transduction histidine kinase